MKILGIEHLGIAVESIDKSAPFWKHILQIAHSSTEDVIDQGVITDIYDTGKVSFDMFSAFLIDQEVNAEMTSQKSLHYHAADR